MAELLHMSVGLLSLAFHCDNFLIITVTKLGFKFLLVQGLADHGYMGWQSDSTILILDTLFSMLTF